MALDRNAIEKRDFPTARDGYDPAAVDTHLRSLAGEVQELRQAVAGNQSESAAATAASQVQGVIAAAEASAEEIKRHATEQARNLREQTLAKAQAYLQAVADACSRLRERLQTLDDQAGALTARFSTSAERLLADLGSLESEMAEAYRAAASGALADTRLAGGDSSEDARSQPPSATGEPGGQEGDLDGARLIALNMALSGNPREQVDRYLAENFTLPDRQRLLDDVYAAVSGK